MASVFLQNGVVADKISVGDAEENEEKELCREERAEERTHRNVRLNRSGQKCNEDLYAQNVVYLV